MNFLVIPAIDLMGGKCVRLQQGDAKRKTVYPKPPAEVAREYEAAGAQRIHVVDLDGAFEGKPKNLEAIQAIRATTKLQIEVGGGIRTREGAKTLLDAGINHAVIGTKALEDPALIESMVHEFGDRIIIGADAREG